MCYAKQTVRLILSSVLVICWLAADLVTTTADEVLPPAWSEFQQALKPIPQERLEKLRKTANDDLYQLMGAAILAEGRLSKDIQRECTERFPETERYFLAHELNQLQGEDITPGKVAPLAQRLTEIDPDNALGHCYLAALAVKSDEQAVLNRHLSAMMKCQLYTAYIDQYLTAHSSALKELNVPFYPVRKVYVIKGVSVGFLVPQVIVREFLVGKADDLAGEGDTDAASKRYEDALLVVGQPLKAQPRLIIVEQYYGRSASRIMTRMAEMWDKNGQSVRAEICRQNARAHDRYFSWTRELVVRKSTLHRLAECTHLNPLDLGFLNSYAEQFRLRGELRANELAPDHSWLSVPPAHSPDEWDWQTGKPKE